ncbi:heterokaryon incompatibility protein-domain-containing protein [Lasiosphaeris hirsuta]|uniref:Heterokaryon incompatibility protein-domain-containing protein n=1 Tax=Lasiosphaeris hirsuta TaxID=260670 RepID=A0AA40DNX9_9PEZI|nr:heterokaryon incompatibility protein-domain-containing protein [Lasiosphaeris hirsuta]
MMVGCIISTGSLGQIGRNPNLESWFVLSTEHDVPFHKDVEYTVVHRDPLSEPTLRYMASWIESCNDEHDCYNGAQASLPSRLLDVRNLDHIILCDSVDLQNRGGDIRYVTLSHCWGSSRDFLTTRQSLPRMKKGFALSEVIPRTFSDAMLATHKLGIPYLWIDSLCIIQYDVADWAVEASRMASVYSNSYVTIAAASSDGDEKGFLQPRPFQYATVKFTSPTGESAIAYLGRKEKSPDHSNGPDDPLFRRAWVFQEQYLSQRTLIFSREQVYFFCQGIGSHLHAENKTQESHAYLNKNFGKIRFSWNSVTRELSTRLLTYDTDKLPSIAGVASTLSTTRESTLPITSEGTLSTTSEGAQRQYCAGIWRDDLPIGFLFHRVGEAKSPSGYLAPSWSWAALNGPVSWLVDECRADRWSREVLLPLDSVQVADCNMMLKDARNPYGQVDEGSSLTIRARFAELEPCLADTVDTSDLSKIPRWQLEPQEEWSPYPMMMEISGSSKTNTPQEIMGSPYKVSPGRLETIAWCKFDMPGQGVDKVIALVAACRSHIPVLTVERPKSEDWEGLVGILVTPVGGESGSNGHRRIGVFEIRAERGTAGQILESFHSHTAVLY